MMTADLTFTSKLGRFTFDANVPLSLAKLLRDSVTGQFFNPRTNEPRLHTEEDCQDYARNHLSKTLGEVPFDLEINIVKEDD